MNSASPIWDEVDLQIQMNGQAPPNFHMPIQSRRRRSYNGNLADGRSSLHLIDDDGLRRWVYEPPVNEQMRSRAARAPLVHSGDILRTFRYSERAGEERGSNRITARLTELDTKLNPHFGLRRLNDGDEFIACPTPPAITGKTLLLVHGTFSKSEMYLTQWSETAHGKELLAKLRQRYDNIMAFDHPTLSVSPWINALDLNFAMKNVTGTIDVVAHSRGGLVVSWWLRLAPSPARHVIFVGSPLDGTSLASPYRIRAALDHLATIADLLAVSGAGLGAVLPIAAGVAGLAKIFGATLRLGAAVPMIDSAVAMIPGLAAQQRTDNNAERRCLVAEKWLPTAATFMVIQADFQPEPSQLALWRVWDRLKSTGAQLVAGAADTIFNGANDLVVDTASMTDFGHFHTAAAGDILDLGSGNTYHTSYFRDQRVTEFLDDRLR